MYSTVTIGIGKILPQRKKWSKPHLKSPTGKVVMRGKEGKSERMVVDGDRDVSHHLPLPSSHYLFLNLFFH